MNILRQIIRLKGERHTQRSITKYLGISRNTVAKYLKLIDVSGFDSQELLTLSDEDLDELFSPDPKGPTNKEHYEFLISKFPYFEKELKKVGVTKLLLWAEYKHEHPEGYGYSQFNHYFLAWLKGKDVSMHFEHKAGDKLFIDYAGKKLEIVDRETGEVIKVEVFIAILGASQLTYVQAVFSQKKEDFIDAVGNSLQYFGGVPKAIVPDNLKAAVVKSDRYEPEINESFQDFALHYGTTILPTRSAKPKDKALVENAVSIAYKRIYAPLRKDVFHSVEELNNAIKVELEKHNDKPLQGKDYSRRELFNEIEKSLLYPLPLNPYEFKHFKWLTVQKNSHVYLYDDKHYYSVPYRYTGERIRFIYNNSIVEIYYQQSRIAYHKRDRTPHKYTTVKSHMPSSHNFVAEWNEEKFINWAEGIGEGTSELVRHILSSKAHPEQAYKSCLGILGYVKKVGAIRLESACKRAVEYQSYYYKTVKRILDNKMEDIELHNEEYPQLPFHQNIRGSEYYNYENQIDNDE